MNENVKNSIDARKLAFFSAYQIDDENLKKEINDLFEQINKLGLTCTDAADFENKFQSSPLNQEYMELFKKTALACKPVVIEHINDVIDDKAENIKNEVVNDLANAAADVTRPARRRIKWKIYDILRDIPIIKEFIIARQYKEFGESLIPNKKDEDNNDRN